MREMFNILMTNKFIEDEEKLAIKDILLNAISAEIYPLEENGLYLRVTDTDDYEKEDVTLWSDHKDEDGNRSVKIVTEKKDEILQVLHRKYLEKKADKGRDL